MRQAVVVFAMLLSGCAFDAPFIIGNPKLGHHYGHTYFGVEVRGTTR